MSCFALNFEVINEEGTDKRKDACNVLKIWIYTLYLYLLNVILLKYLVYIVKDENNKIEKAKLWLKKKCCEWKWN